MQPASPATTAASACRRGEVVRNIVAIRAGPTPATRRRVPRIVAIGSLIPRKAHDVLLRAAALLAGAGKTFELWIAGGGPERSRLEALAAELQVAERVRFLGEVADAQDLLATAHVFAHPAHSEGLSNAILEAMAEGVPVVATPAGATVELIEHDRTGLLVTVGCPQSLAAALGRLLDDPSLREKLGQAGLARVREECGEAARGTTVRGNFHRSAVRTDRRRRHSLDKIVFFFLCGVGVHRALGRILFDCRALRRARAFSARWPSLFGCRHRGVHVLGAAASPGL